jgi:zinc transport system ATP-binding protein
MSEEPRNSPGEELLRTSGVTVRIGGRTILDRIELILHAGEIVTVIGPNGAGKTTLLRVALGLIQPTEGTVRNRTGLRIGYMPQRLLVDGTFPLSVRRFLSLAAPVKGHELQETLSETGAHALVDHPLSGLSGGELQRVLLARALLRRPDLLVLDEPAQGLDVHGQMEFFHLIGEIRKKRGCAILLVSHDLHLVMASTDRVVCLNRHICCTGTPAVVSRDPAFLKLFGPLAGQNLAVYTHDSQHRHPQ